MTVPSDIRSYGTFKRIRQASSFTLATNRTHDSREQVASFLGLAHDPLIGIKT